MFGGLGRFVVRRAWWVIAAWIVVAFGIIATAPSLADITSADQGSFLPKSYESLQAIELGEKAFPRQTTSVAIIVVKRADGQPLTATDSAAVGQVAQTLQAKNIGHTSGYLTGPPPALTALLGHKAWWPGHGDVAPAARPAGAQPAGRP